MPPEGYYDRKSQERWEKIRKLMASKPTVALTKKDFLRSHTRCVPIPMYVDYKESGSLDEEVVKDFQTMWN
jgi:hypothetical protein